MGIAITFIVTHIIITYLLINNNLVNKLSIGKGSIFLCVFILLLLDLIFLFLGTNYLKPLLENINSNLFTSLVLAFSEESLKLIGGLILFLEVIISQRVLIYRKIFPSNNETTIKFELLSFFYFISTLIFLTFENILYFYSLGSSSTLSFTTIFLTCFFRLLYSSSLHISLYIIMTEGTRYILKINRFNCSNEELDLKIISFQKGFLFFLFFTLIFLLHTIFNYLLQYGTLHLSVPFFFIIFYSICRLEKLYLKNREGSNKKS